MTFSIQSGEADYYQPATQTSVRATGLSAVLMERAELTQMRERLLGHRPEQPKTRSSADFLRKRHSAK